MSDAEIVIFLVFLISLFINLVLYYFPFTKVLKIKNGNSLKTNMQPVSVIIAARNEAENLKINLPYILQQNYFLFEVIIADDYSTDATCDVIKDLQKDYGNIKLVKNNQLQGKKQALTTAILSSKYERLIFTDADCRPSSNKWIELMSRMFTNNKEIVLGFGMYETHGIQSEFIQYDTQLIALQYSASVINGHPYMGVGRNIGYTKQVWEKNNGFNDHTDILSGDDDLFVAKAATNSNTDICVNPDSITISESPESLGKYIKMKARHINTSSKYSFSNLLYSGGELLSRAIVYISFIFLLETSILIPLFLTLIIRLIYISTIIGLFSVKINHKISVPCIIIFDIFAPVFYGILIFYKLLIHNKKQW